MISAIPDVAPRSDEPRARVRLGPVMTRRYDHYRPSTIAWVDEVPAHWEPTKLGSISSLKGRLGWQGLKADEYRVEGPYVVSSAHFDNFRVAWDECPRVSLERYEIDNNIQLAANDLLLMKDGAALGKLAFVDHLPGPACLNSHLLLFRPLMTNDEVAYEPRFLFYFMQTGHFQTYIKLNGTGATFLGVSQEAIARYRMDLPPLEEQVAIVAFLDRETAKIDGLVDKQRRLIELLEEKRQAVISHAVTKGLDGAVPMKDSGVEWLGQVPLHWEVVSVRRIITEIEQGWSPECEAREAEIGEWGVLKTGCVNCGSFNQHENKALPPRLTPLPELEVRQGDVLMSRANGSRELVGSVAFVEEVRAMLLLSDKIFRFKFSQKCDSRFFVLSFSSTNVRSQIVQAISGAEGLANNLPQSRLKEIRYCLPPLAEQQHIVKCLKSLLHALDELAREAEKSILLLQERRSALISAATTGKIDVRGLVLAEAEAA